MGVTVDPKTGNPEGSTPTILQFQNNFIPAEATSNIQYNANLPTTPKTTASATAASGTVVANGGMNPSDLSQNPFVAGTPAQPYSNNGVVGSAVENEATTPAAITANTHLAGTSRQRFADQSLHHQRHHHRQWQDNHLQRYGGHQHRRQWRRHQPNHRTVQDVLTAIDQVTGNTANPSTVSSSGAITLNTGTQNNLNVTSSAAGWGAMGLTGTRNRRHVPAAVARAQVLSSARTRRHLLMKASAAAQ